MQLARRLCVVLFVATALLVGAPAHGDKVSGTWTGQVDVRGNYYLERSTRVVAPEMKVLLEPPKGPDVRVDYLIDVITSASVAAGALEDVRFNEVRHEVGVGSGYEFDVGDQQLRIDGEFRISKEPDWLSTSGFIGAQLFLAQRATVFRTSFRALHDEVRQNFRGGAQIRPGAPTFNEDFEAFALSFSWEQVLTPQLTMQIGYDLGLLSGYLANPYRTVMDGRPETHPDRRRRHTLSGRLAYYIPTSGTSLQALYRSYFDSWDVGAINPEARIYQEIGESVQVRLRYRYYRQTSSFFARADGAYVPSDVFVTNDPKMLAFNSHEAGLHLLILGEFLRGKADRISDATVDLNFARIWSTSRFGSGWVAIVGSTFPF